jgi:hypothetical protein
LSAPVVGIFRFAAWKAAFGARTADHAAWW